MFTFKPQGFHNGVFLYAIVTALIGIGIGVPALAGLGSFSPLEATIGWGGRELGLGVVAVVAIYSRQSGAYLALFAGGTFRELSDILELLHSDAGIGLLASGLVTLALDIICTIYSYKALKEQELENAS